MATADGLAVSGSWVRTDEPLLWLGGAGHQVCKRDYQWDCHRRQDAPHYCLQLTLSGQGFHEDARGRSLLPPGRAFLSLIPGPFRYGYATESRAPYEQVYVSMRGPACELWCRQIIQSFGHILTFGEDNPIAPLMLAIARQHRDGALGDRYAISSQLYQLLMTILSLLNASRVATQPRMTRALAMIAQHGHESQFTVTRMADELQCSREYLARQFHSATGVSPSDYLMQHRLRLAVREMRATSDKLDLIARRCGLSGANYLCRAFRQRYGITPARFRARPWTVAP